MWFTCDVMWYIIYLHTYFISDFQLSLRQHELLYHMKMIALYCIHESTEPPLKKNDDTKMTTDFMNVQHSKLIVN